MKLEVDTKEKIIKLAETVNLSELVEVLDKLFPNSSWKEYKLETNTIIYDWASPTIIYRDRYWPSYPWGNPLITWGIGTAGNLNNVRTTTSSQGTYNLSIN